MSNLSLSDLQDRIRRLETQLEEMELNKSSRVRLIPLLLFLAGVNLLIMATPTIPFESDVVRNIVAGLSGGMISLGLFKLYK